MTFESIRSKISDDLKERYEERLNLLDSSISETRGVSHQLMPANVDEYGLKTALSSFIQYLDSTHQRTSFYFYTNLDEDRFLKPIELGLSHYTGSHEQYS